MSMARYMIAFNLIRMSIMLTKNGEYSGSYLHVAELTDRKHLYDCGPYPKGLPRVPLKKNRMVSKL